MLMTSYSMIHNDNIQWNDDFTNAGTNMKLHIEWINKSDEKGRLIIMTCDVLQQTVTSHGSYTCPSLKK